MIDSNREEFEKLPEIAKILKDEDTHWCDKRSIYINQRVFQDSITGYLNGAWYAFQEQQKKLDCCREENKAHLEKIDEAWNELDDRNSKEYIIENLEKILKGNKDEN